MVLALDGDGFEHLHLDVVLRIVYTRQYRVNGVYHVILLQHRRFRVQHLLQALLEGLHRLHLFLAEPTDGIHLPRQGEAPLHLAGQARILGVPLTLLWSHEERNTVFGDGRRTDLARETTRRLGDGHGRLTDG